MIRENGSIAKRLLDAYASNFMEMIFGWVLLGLIVAAALLTYAVLMGHLNKAFFNFAAIVWIIGMLWMLLIGGILVGLGFGED